MAEYIDVVESALAAGASALMRHFGAIDRVQTKTNALDLVTIADRESESLIRSVLRQRYPSHAILGEEMGLDCHTSSDFRWLVDPLDGTTNYAHGVPIFAVSVALEHRGEIVAAGVYNPVSHEKFLAERGGGARLNGQKINVSRTESLAESLLVTGFPHSSVQILQQCLREVAYFLGKVHGILRLGAAALDMCYVACGRLEVFWQRNLHPWDTAAGWLIVEEAGGRVSDFSGAKFSPYGKELVCSNGRIHEEFLDWLRRAHEHKVL